MTSIDGAGPARDEEVISVAAERGPLAMEAVSLDKDFRLGRGQVLHAVRAVSFGLYLVIAASSLYQHYFRGGAAWKGRRYGTPAAAGGSGVTIPPPRA